MYGESRKVLNLPAGKDSWVELGLQKFVFFGVMKIKLGVFDFVFWLLIVDWSQAIQYSAEIFRKVY